MPKMFVVSKKQLRLVCLLLLAIAFAAVCLKWTASRDAMSAPRETRAFELVTGEFKTTTKDGKELEVYRWDPASIVVHKGEAVELRITGVNGASHPFVIHELGVKGEVNKGQTTVVRFTAEQRGTFAIECLTHTSLANGGPMVGYITVL
ncbi:Cupredoxin-like domain-containing protein [Paenibacillus sp. UNC496MF]|uniref:cupredoxin domain-containing protein n=1 Tax=Paenibacillus sp. UNC496MF TaxID=1502753 RepID=UPI0008EE51BA|nr:cupredoxin domain-containing protein [Paenibacillus sp. UNC496MF]SFI89568.1 Cupredoxin-like domain-containing protein [Paenibacillus sp. UNC496MF]